MNDHPAPPGTHPIPVLLQREGPLRWRRLRPQWRLRRPQRPRLFPRPAAWRSQTDGKTNWILKGLVSQRIIKYDKRIIKYELKQYVTCAKIHFSTSFHGYWRVLNLILYFLGELPGRPSARLCGQRAVRRWGPVPPNLRSRSHLQPITAKQLPATRPLPMMPSHTIAYRRSMLKLMK